MAAIQAIFIRGHEERTSPKPHTVYKIEIQGHVRSWHMWRRYSEFDELHTELTKAVGSPPPCALPPKHKLALFAAQRKDPERLEERRAGLEAFLRAILGSKDELWRESVAFKVFLGIPVTRNETAGTSSLASGAGGQTPSFTSASWLDEHAELQARVRDVWADIHKRDALADQGDVSAAHKSNVAAKSRLAGVLARIGTLGRGLQALAGEGMSEGELQRRTDMVARLQDDCEKLGKVVAIARQQGIRQGAGSTGSATATVTTAEMEGKREALLGGTTEKPARRVFGAPPKETEATRPLDSVGLLGMQQAQIQQQDNQLSQLTTILQRQRHLGEAISSEIAQQIDILDDLNNEVDRVGGKLQSAGRQLNKVS